MRPAGALCALAIAALSSACAAPQTAGILAGGGDLPARAEVADVPFYPQERYYCGPAALAMALTWSGEPVTQAALVPQVYTASREGTLRNDMLAAARRHGRLAVPIGDVRSLLAEIAAGHPVIVFQNLALDWSPQWHYAVAFGYDLRERQIVLHSGTRTRRASDLYAFERTWERGDYWGLAILPPDRLPATASERAVLEAAAGLERTGRLPEAAAAYQAIASRWPESFGARMGLGNVRYRQSDFAGAERAFRQAARQRPEAPEAWNNLAYALARQGLLESAEDAARRAVRLAPGDAEPYRDTLQDISRRES